MFFALHVVARAEVVVGGTLGLWRTMAASLRAGALSEEWEGIVTQFVDSLGMEAREEAVHEADEVLAKTGEVKPPQAW